MPVNPQDILNAGQGVNIAGTQMTVDQLMGELGLNAAQVNQQQAQATQGLGYTEAQAGIQQEQMGIQGAGLQAQQGLLGTQYGIQQATLQGQEQLAGTQRGLEVQGEQAAQAAQQVQYGNQQAATQGQIATSGAVGSVGAQRQVATEAFQNQQAQAALQRQATGSQAQYGFQQQQFGLEQQGQAAQQAYSMGDIARGEQGLQLASQANGLSLDQTINQVGYGMQQAGLAGQQNYEQIQGQLGQAIGQGATASAGALGYGALLGGINLNQSLAGRWVMAKKKKSEDTAGTGEDQGIIGEARHDIAAGVNDVAPIAESFVDPTGALAVKAGSDILGGLFGGDSKPAGKPPESADQKEIDKLKGELKTAQGAEKTAAPSDAYTQLADAQAKQYLQATQALDPLTSGSALPAVEATASQQASQMLGQSATSPTSQWLNAQTQAAQAQNAPVTAAMGQTKVAEDYASTLFNQGIQNMGQAEDKMLQAAPYQQLLQTLAADVPYKLLGGTPFSSITPEVASAVSSIPGLSTTAVPTAAAASAPQINTGIVPPAPAPTGYNAPSVGP